MAKKRNFNQTFTDRLKNLMESRNVTVAELAKVCDISRQSIMNYLACESMPNINVCKDIAAYFDVSCDYLIGKDQQLQITDETLFKELGLTSATLNKLRALKEYAEEEDEGALLLYTINRVFQEEDVENAQGIFQELARFISRPDTSTYFVTESTLNNLSTQAALGQLQPEQIQSIKRTHAVNPDDLEMLHLFPVQQALKTFASIYRAKYQKLESAGRVEYRNKPNADGFYYDEDTDCYCKDGKWYHLTEDGYELLQSTPTPI